MRPLESPYKVIPRLAPKGLSRFPKKFFEGIDRGIHIVDSRFRGNDKKIFIGILFVFLYGVAAVNAETDSVSFEDLEKEIGEFAQIDEGIYRGAQPTEEEFQLLKKFGIRTVVNFHHEKNEIEWERKTAEGLGMNYVSLPWRIQSPPRTEVMESFLALMGQKEEGPFFIHCRRGAERSGVADAVYRYYYQKLSYEEAYRKATEGFRVLFYWKPFMKWRYQDFVRELEAGGFSAEGRGNSA